MSTTSNQNIFYRIKIAVNERVYQFKKFRKIVWPINWTNLQNLDLVADSWKNSFRWIKAILVVSIAGVLISVLFFFQGLYLVLTRSIPASGSTLNEVVYFFQPDKFSPVLTPKNETEKKITSLLFAPLYTVSYPDFLGQQSQNPTIKPVLIRSEPVWIESEKGKSLRFELKDNLKWSDGTDLTIDDVAYTFERLKEPNGNEEFRDVLANYKFTQINQTEFSIDPISNKIFNPQLRYLMNFAPISQKYFENKKTDDIALSEKSFQTMVTSGYYTVAPKIKIDGNEQVNPFRDAKLDTYTIALTENKNAVQKPFISNYTLKVYNDLFQLAGSSNQSVESAVLGGKIDLFSRTLTPGLEISPQEVQEKFKLNQQILPTNTYYMMYANLLPGQWLINQALRKDIFCGFGNFNIARYSNILESIPQSKKLIPPQFGTDKSFDCTNVREELLNQKTKAGASVYTLVDGKVVVDGKQVEINILSPEENKGILDSVKAKLDELGFASTLSLSKDVADFERLLAEKQYNLVLIPNTIVSRDPYPMFGAKFRNISSLNKNNRIGDEATKFGEGVENMLKQYSESDLQNPELKTKIIDLFGKEYISLNLFRVKEEINYSNRILLGNKGFEPSLTFVSDIYKNLPQWYIDTSRKFIWDK